MTCSIARNSFELAKYLIERGIDLDHPPVVWADELVPFMLNKPTPYIIVAANNGNAEMF
jgi:hypothetical protein